MNQFLDKLAKLIDVKSICTFIVVIGLIVFTNSGKIDGDKFYQIVTMIITFYFGSKVGEAQASAGNTLTIETPVQVTTQKPNILSEITESSSNLGG